MSEDLQENLQEEEVQEVSVSEENEEEVQEVSVQEENEEEVQEIDYSSLLSEMNENILSLQSEIIVLQEQNADLINAQNGLISNTYWVVYFCFAFFIFGALILVIKFLKQFF